MPSDDSSDKPTSSDPQSHPPSSRPPHPNPIAFVFDIPRAVFDHGVEHGREWRRVCKGEDHESKLDSDRRWRCRRPMSRNEADNHSQKSTSASTTATGGLTSANGGDDDDWYNWTRRELEKGERRAKEIYDSWNAEQPKQKDSSSTGSISKSSDISSSDGWQGWPLSRLEDFFKQIRGSAPEPQSPETLLNNLLKSHAELERQMASMTPFSPMRDFAGPWPSFKQGHVMGYITSSEYSPLVLETEPGFDSTWRARFEDLIRADQGDKMLEAKEARKTCTQSHWEWLWRFEPQEPESKDGTYNKFLGFGNEQKSELDAYEHLLSKEQDSVEKNTPRD